MSEKFLIQPSRCTQKLGDITESHVCEVKMDGGRYVLYLGYDPYERQRLNALLSRRISVVDGKHVDRTGNIPHITAHSYPDLEGTVIDGEIFLKDWATTSSIIGSNPHRAVEKQKEKGNLFFFAFDVPVFRGVDIRNRPLADRRKVLIETVRRMDNESVVVIPQWPWDEVNERFNEIVSGGGEGLIIKDIRRGYGLGWSKMKKSYDVSCFICGFKPGNGKYSGMVGAIEVAVWDGGAKLPVGFASGFDDKLREDITKEPERFLGRAVDIFAQELSPNNRLRHPTFFRFRDGIDIQELTIEKLKADFESRLKDRRRKVLST